MIKNKWDEKKKKPTIHINSKEGACASKIF